ncbi:DUF2339 domain-containing protein, partial [Neorhizobium sp. SHOUNA12B]|uniref:DUF2339 domain-containing protein n=1 Tax=Neorhizobium sp. SHOUNA12B TaxID=2908928 RepID=UPI00260042A8
MIEILLLLLVILMVGLYRKTSTRVAALEKELEAIKVGLLSTQPVSTAAPVAAPATVPAAAAVIATEAVTEEPAVRAEPVLRAEPVAAEAVPEETIAASVAAEDVAAREEAPAPVATTTRTPTPAKPKNRENLESYLGARWPVWVGGVALAFGGIFLVRASIEAGLLGPG